MLHNGQLGCRQGHTLRTVGSTRQADCSPFSVDDYVSLRHFELLKLLDPKSRVKVSTS